MGQKGCNLITTTYMKTNRIHYTIITFLLLNAFSLPLISGPVNEDPPTKKGAKTEKDLSQIIFTAIKSNKLDIINQYIPQKAEIDYLKNKSSKKNKIYFEKLDAEKLKTDNRKNFEKVIQKGIDKGINWSTVELIDYETLRCDIEEIGCRLQFNIQDAKGKSLKFSYDAVKVNDSWFIFQLVKVEE